MNTLWHTKSLEDLFTELGSSDAGLSKDEAIARLSAYGRNELPEEKGESAWMLFVDQFKSPLMYIMMAAIMVSFVIGNKIEGWFIFVVMISNALVGFWQEHKANESLASLKNIVRLFVRVVRDKSEQEIDATEIVPGDIIVLRAGDKVPADGRIVLARNLKISESVLTGEARPVEKKMVTLLPEKTEVGDRTNMVFMGTIVEEGTATVLVVGTGINTEYGDIVMLLKDTPEEATPLQKTVSGISKFIGIFITLVVSLIILQGYFAGLPFHDIFESALALFVSAIPEGLLPGITIVLVLGMRRILKRKGLVRRLAATETLGGVTVICTDKTGTLTEGKMEASRVLTADGLFSLSKSDGHIIGRSIRESMRIAILATDAYIENPGSKYSDLIVRGNLTEQALLRMGVRWNLAPHELVKQEELQDSLLFSSERKYGAYLRVSDGKRRLYVLGAPENVLAHVSAYMTESGNKRATGKAFAKLIADKDAMIAKGYRVIACAYRDMKATGKITIDKSIERLVLAGFIAISDPIRSDVPAAFEKTHKAGIRTAIITGDHVLTARNIAEKVGLVLHDNAILEGHEIEKLSDTDLRARVRHTVLFARVSPRHKLRIVEAFQKNGEVVAMLGDGVNDAPALKAANIGVAVDTRVAAARETADLVLLDGGFATIIAAVEQGRIIFQNIRKVFLYLITQDFSQFFLFITAIALGLPLPILAVQLLLVNLVESGLPDLALTTEQENEGVMQEPPRSPKESILNTEARKLMFSMFAVSGSLAFILYFSLLPFFDIDTIRTMVMTFLCMESLFLVLCVRSFKKSIIRKDIFSNKILTGAVIISFVMVLSVVYIPALQNILKTISLSGIHWAILLSVNVIEILLIDRCKLFFFRKKQKVFIPVVN